VEASIPSSPFGTKLIGRGQIARYHLGADNARNRRRITALMGEVRPANRIPHGRDGDGQPFSYTGWLDSYALKRAKNLPEAASGG
jgi:hypothetical protein